MNQATAVCMVLKFMVKFNLEVLNCSTSLMSSHRFDWTIKNIGLLGFVNGCLVVPTTIFVGFLSQYYTDWKLLLCLLGVALLRSGFITWSDRFFPHIWRCRLQLSNGVVVTGSEEVYSWTNNRILWLSSLSKCCDGTRTDMIWLDTLFVNLFQFKPSHSFIFYEKSMLSKVIPLSLAKGAFNLGFITTDLTTVSYFNIRKLFICVIDSLTDEFY